MPRKKNFNDSEDDEKIIQQIGNTRYVKKKHEKTIKDSLKGVINEEFVDKMKECKLTGAELKVTVTLECDDNSFNILSFNCVHFCLVLKRS